MEMSETIPPETIAEEFGNQTHEEYAAEEGNLEEWKWAEERLGSRLREKPPAYAKNPPTRSRRWR